MYLWFIQVTGSRLYKHDPTTNGGGRDLVAPVGADTSQAYVRLRARLMLDYVPET